MHPDPDNSNPGGADAPAPGAPGGRRDKRVAISIVVTLCEFGEGGVPGDGWECDALNISAMGIGVLSIRAVGEGATVAVLIPLPDGTMGMSCGLVRTSLQQPGGWHVLGIETIEVPDSPPLRAWRRRVGVE